MRQIKNDITVCSGTPNLSELTKSEISIVSVEVFSAAQAAIED